MQKDETSFQDFFGAFQEIKEQFQDKVLLIRYGDFYESFGTDAETIAKATGITLTKEKINDEESIALTGFSRDVLCTNLKL